FGEYKKTVQSTELAHRVKTIESPGKHFVHVPLVTHIHHESVAWRVEHPMQRNRQLNHAKVRPEMSTGLGKNFDQLIAHVLRELRQILLAKSLDVSRRADSIEWTLGRGCCLGDLRTIRRV